MRYNGHITGATLALAIFLVPFAVSDGQTKTTKAAAPTEALESLGVGVESRFDSGTTPIKIDRVNILPGAALNVKPTMDTMVGANAKSFGGILSRYDTTKFGKFFASGSLAARTSTAKKTKLHATDARVDNSDADASRLYPPRLVLDETLYPVSNIETAAVRHNVVSQVRSLERRFGLAEGQVVLVFEQDRLILRGQIHSEDQKSALVNVLAMEPGIDRIESQLTIVAPTPSDAPVVPVLW